MVSDLSCSILPMLGKGTGTSGSFPSKVLLHLMTAIALLDADGELPYLVCDSLLTCEGWHENERRRAWLPALGMVAVNYESNGVRSHISRLARKSLLLSNSCGIVAFNGDCGAAHQFWLQLSSECSILRSRNEHYLVEPHIIDRCIRDIGSTAEQFGLIAVLHGSDGRRHVVCHGSVNAVSTENFGTCLLAGSGAHLVEDVIQRNDAMLTQARGWPTGCGWSAVEDLAEHICSELLYRESDIGNGGRGTPLASACGGVYEWFAVSQGGVRIMPPRIEFNIRTEESAAPVITRAYAFEHFERPAAEGADIRKAYSLGAISLALDPIAIPPSAPRRRRGWRLNCAEAHAAFVPQMQSLYDPSAWGIEPDYVHGPLTTAFVRRHYREPSLYHRVRAIVGDSTGENAVMSRLVASSEDPPLASLSCGNRNRVVLTLSPRVLHLIARKIASGH